MVLSQLMIVAPRDAACARWRKACHADGQSQPVVHWLDSSGEAAEHRARATPAHMIRARAVRIGVLLVVLGLGGLALWRFVLAPSDGTPGVIAVSGRIEGDDATVAAKTSGRIRQISVREG